MPKKEILKTALMLMVMVVSLSMMAPANALAEEAANKQAIKLEGFEQTGFFAVEGRTGTEKAKTLISKTGNALKNIVGAVAILMIFISAVKLITAQGNEEVYKKQQQTLIFAIIGLVIIGMAGELSTIFETEDGGFLKDPNTGVARGRLFNRAIQTVITLIRWIVGSIAVLFVVRSGFHLITHGANDEEVTKDKTALAYSVIGLMFIILATPLVNNVFFKIDTSRYPGVQAVRPIIDSQAGIAQIVGITNIIVAFSAPLATLSLLLGAVLYMMARGDDTKIQTAKRMITWSLIGLIVIYGAFGVVTTMIAGRFEGI